MMQVVDPAPRIALLQALSDPSCYISPVATAQLSNGPSFRGPSASRKTGRVPVDHVVIDQNNETSSIPTTKSPDIAGTKDEEGDANGELREMETLFSLWKSAGRSVNLWDWLEGYRSTMNHQETDTRAGEEDDQEEHGVETAGKRQHSPAPLDPNINGNLKSGVLDDEAQARLHATFVRFCEEARMLGLVRARGKGTGKRGDEVIKGIGLL